MCISDDSAARFATALYRYRHPLKLGGQQWRRREKRKQRRRKRRSVGRRSSATPLTVFDLAHSRRPRHTGRLASRLIGALPNHRRDAPAQVNDGGRRRDGGSSFNFARKAPHGAADEDGDDGRSIPASPWQNKPVDLILGPRRRPRCVGDPVSTSKLIPALRSNSQRRFLCRDSVAAR